MTDARIKQWVEPGMHAFAFFWGFGTALTSAAMGFMNNANLWCWIAPYPTGCLGSDDIDALEVPTPFCTGGSFISYPCGCPFLLPVSTIYIYIYMCVYYSVYNYVMWNAGLLV
jgi:hypothetical protein